MRVHKETNKDQNNSVKSGIARLYSPGGSIGLTVYLQFAIACLGSGFGARISPFPVGRGPSFNTICYWTLQVYLSNYI